MMGIAQAAEATQTKDKAGIVRCIATDDRMVDNILSHSC